MDVLYKKLYEKYSTVKAKRFSQLDQTNKDLEKRFQEYLNAADAFVEQLMVENDKLRAESGDLRIENDKLRAESGDLQNDVASLGSAKDQKWEDSQKLLSEERRKNEELIKEIDKLRKLQQEGGNQNQETDTPEETPVRRSKRLSDGKNQNQETFTPQDTLVRKRRRVSGKASDSVSTEFHSDTHNSRVSEPSLSLSQENIYNVDRQQPWCCRSSNDSGLCSCPFQDLVEWLMGMKVSAIRQSDHVGICALHQSSGYSFELTWLKKADTRQTEFMYRVSSLGTFERFAPEWMREAIIFNIIMCPVFFERVSRFVKHPV